MSNAMHTYPPAYPPGQHWALDEAWSIMDTLTPGAISDDIRILLAGMIYGTLTRLAREGRIDAPPQSVTESHTIVYNGIPWTFRYADTYCPRCGHQGVWLEGDDYHVGATGHCLACEHTHRNAGEFEAFGDFERAAGAALQAEDGLW